MDYHSQFKKEISPLVENAILSIEEKDTTKEEVLRCTRKLNRVSGRAINNLIKNDSVEKELSEAKHLAGDIVKLMKKLSPLTSWSIVQPGIEEYCEFLIFYSILNCKKIPSYTDLDIPAWLWLLSLGDVIGELRRYILNKLLKKEIAKAKFYLQIMECLYSMIVGLTFSKAIIGSLRNKIDIARNILERTEGDVLYSLLRSNK